MRHYIPQILMICMMFWSLMNEALHHGEVKKPEKYNFFTSLLAQVIQGSILWWGGFWK